MKTSQWSAALIALLLFCSGGVVGALADRYYSASVVNAKTSEDFRRRDLTEMQTRLKLNSSQVTQLEAIMDNTKAKYKTVRESYRPQMLQIRQDHIGRVKSILTADQIAAYDRLLAERERHAKEQEERDRAADQAREARRQQTAK
jgi:capsule polysaccharide export protein KpsE/RkpR